MRVARAAVRAGEELWIDCGEVDWRQMSLYCPHCLEYGGDEQDGMLLCGAPGCKRAWHQLCVQPRWIDVPCGPFFCDVHARGPVPGAEESGEEQEEDHRKLVA